MTHSTSLHSFTAELDALDRALEAPRGIRVQCDNPTAAETYRHRLHKARTLDRRESRAIYPEGDPLYNKSQYDPLIVRIRTIDEKVYVYIELSRMPTEIEEL